MRILAIRGCNLASLAGEFEVELDKAPLGGAGVFAIVGNTGAGKSTLLDAMCAALFDRTPRLGTPSRVQVGRGPDDPLALGATDVRTLLRRGAASGYAEVDFESGDARRYRARWAVRRARGNSDGALQDQHVSLVALDGTGDDRLGGTKTETLKTIQQRLGLTFDQFRRSALLAQGEFAAFLRADGKDRSELLERMTGTEIYSRLSIAAHVRATRAELELRDRRGAAHAIVVLADDVRAERVAELDAARLARTAARETLALAEAAARWLAEAARRGGALAEARAVATHAHGAVEAAAGERTELALRRRAETTRPAWLSATRTAAELAVATTLAADAETAAVAARQMREQAMARCATAAANHAPIRAARLAAGLVERVANAARGRGDVDAAAEAAWLVDHAELAAEVAAWPGVERRIAGHAAEVAAIAGIDHELAAKAAQAERLVTLRNETAVEQGEALGRLETARRRAAAMRERNAGPSLDGARRAEDAARLRCADVAKLGDIAAAARVRAATRGAVADELAVLDAASARDATAAVDAVAARDVARAAIGEIEHALAALRRIAGYGHARTELVAGEPCPLCGATEHPWHDRGELSAAIGDAETRRGAARTREAAAAGEVVAVAARAAHRATERARLVARGDALDGERAGVVTAWRKQLAALAELPLVDDPHDLAATQLAAERAAAADAAFEAARAARAHVEAGLKAAADAQQEVLARQSDVQHAAVRVAAVDDDRRAIAAIVERFAGERAARTTHASELAVAIDAELARWRDVTGDRPEAGSGKLVAGSRVPQADGGSPQAAAFAGAMVVIVAVVAQWHRAAERVAATDAVLAAADVELGRALAAAERAVAEAETRAAEATARRDALARERDTAHATLAEAATAVDLDLATVRHLLAATPARTAELVTRLDALGRTAELAAAVAAERARDADAHAALQPVALDDAGRVDELARTTQRADDRVAELAAELAADAAARDRRAASLAELARAEAACEVDRVLGDVIGSHDGKLFRSFAQSLTLDALLAVANAHLDELAPRYRLERVPRHDLELQVVDRELGGELRSVQTLSGGESFLVSLALALGLSAMSAHDVRVKTLLIDEGFGTLDPATLDTALAVLDRLQATGRQIGVISHVPALVERVGAHVRVVQRGNGRSEVVVAG